MLDATVNFIRDDEAEVPAASVAPVPPDDTALLDA